VTQGRSRAADVAVVGAGVIGLAVAHELARRGLAAVVVERDRAGGGATWASGGMLAPYSEAERDPPELTALALDSLARYPAYARELERDTGVCCGLSDAGTLWVALHRDHEAELDHFAATLALRGYPAERLAAGELRRLEPGLSPRAVAGLRLADDRQVDPRALVRALVAALRRESGEIVEGVRVERVLAAGGKTTGLLGRAADGEPVEVHAPRVVLAAGAWSEPGIALPIPRLGLRPVKGQLVRLRGPRPLARHVIRTPDAYLVPRAGGELLVGATMEDLGFDLTPTAGAVLDLLRRGFEVLPGSYDLELSEIAVGLRSALDDPLPAIGATEVNGLYLALGHCRNGVLLAPATAQHLAATIVEGVTAPVIAPCSPARLAARAGARDGRAAGA